VKDGRSLSICVVGSREREREREINGKPALPPVIEILIV
jgi:hypothetical protein